MKHISILVPKGNVALSTIEGPYIAFTKVNEFLGSKGKPPLFEVQLVGLTKEPQAYDRLFRVLPDLVIGEVEKTGLIIIPAINGDMKAVIDNNKDFLPWIINQYHKGAELASFCVGAFLLASTGLLNGKKCSTHWLAANNFRQLFPEVELVSDKIITDEHGIYSSGGANSFWNLILYLIEKYIDREMAILTAKYFVIEIDRKSQSSFMMFKGQRDHNDESVKKAQEFIENNFQEKITVDELSDMVGVGRRSFERRFKKVTCNSVIEYIQRVKIEAAKMSLETSRQNVNEVMYDVGYNDPKSFRITFKRITGLSPIQYRNKYNKAIQMSLN